LTKGGGKEDAVPNFEEEAKSAEPP